MFAPVMPGVRLANGRYTVLRQLSRGGMGAVYLAADHDTFDRTVVVKALLDGFDPLQPDEAATARFLDEARTLSRLRHPAIPRIFSYFAADPHHFIVMEYIAGRDLERQLSREDDATGLTIPGQPYAERDVLCWGVVLCRVLEYLASRQPHPVVHHDIKPANLVLDDESGEIILVDFGTARPRLPAHEKSVGRRRSSAHGTVGYAPPEQYSGQSEPRSDVYALAATLYHLLTDDDPRDHPFDFPRCKELGAFGDLLAAALDRDVRRRPAATVFRQQIEALLAPRRVYAIQAPDGAPLSGEQELARWCEQHWRAAARWLYDRRKLPEQIERFWARNKLAADIRGIIRAHPRDPDAGLDAVLAALDPHGYGAAHPQLDVDQPSIDFGGLAAGAVVERSLRLVNRGRRYLRLDLQLPKWVQLEAPVAGLSPGEERVLKLCAAAEQLSISSRVDGHALILAGGDVVARVLLQASVSRWRTVWQRITQPRTQPAPATGAGNTKPSNRQGPSIPRSPVARLAASSQAAAQSKAKPLPRPQPGAFMIRNRGGAVAWLTKAERQKIESAARRCGGEPRITSTGIRCWHDFYILCRDARRALDILDLLKRINASKKGVTQLDLEIVSGDTP